MRARAAAVGFVLLSALSAVGAFVVAGDDAGAASVTLTLDGAAFKPELASTPGAREKGLMYRSTAPKDGMLFVFPRPTASAFWMKDTRVPLTITFFDAAGKRVRRLSMKPCRRDPCAIYDPGDTYRFALEMRVSDRRPAKRLGPASELRRLVQSSS